MRRYVKPGRSGKGHSDPVDLESATFSQILETVLSQEPLPFAQHIRQAAKLIEEIVKGSDLGASLFEKARAAILGEVAFDGEIAVERALDSALVTI